MAAIDLDNLQPRDETRLIMMLFDKDRDGSVSRTELLSILQTLDAEQFTKESMDEMLAEYDANGDEELQFSEFWGWVNGHGGRSVDHFRPALLEIAVESYRKRESAWKAAEVKREATKRAKEEAAAAVARKEDEREAGDRITKKEFIEGRQAVGLSKGVANRLYGDADDDGDGDVDRGELGRLAQNDLATPAQIRGVFQEGVQGESGNVKVKDVNDEGMRAMVDAFSAWDVDGDGTITAAELGNVLKVLNPRFTDVTVAKMMKEIDTNGDGIIDLAEFIAWLNGENVKKKKMKKKAQEDTDAKVACAMHRKRHEEAREMRLQKEFEEACHRVLGPWCEKKKVKLDCNTLNAGPGAPSKCTKCDGRHAWLCHGCGVVTFFDECVNGCSTASAGWSCITSKCAKKCGCKKKPDFWQRSGRTRELSALQAGVRLIIENS